MKRITSIAAVLCTLACTVHVHAQTQTTQKAEADHPSRPSLQAQVSPVQDRTGLPYRPKPGDKLGYSKEESTRRLAPEYRALLDGILRLYHEPGLFANRREVFSAIGTVPGKIQPLSHSVPRRSVTDRFRQYAAPQGLFAKEGWSAEYEYDGRETKDGKTTWFALLSIRLPYKQECVDSRAVEGYLDLYLDPGIDGLAHPLPADRWDRHKFGGRPFAVPVSNATPGVSLNLVGGCLAIISLGNRFNYEEMSDEHVIN